MATTTRLRGLAEERKKSVRLKLELVIAWHSRYRVIVRGCSDRSV